MDGGVLSDTDIKYEILCQNLVEDPEISNVDENRNIQPSCYDLTIGYIVTRGGIIEPASAKRAYVLKPGEVATLFSRQIIHLPREITGLLIPRNGPAIRGLLMLNLGHVDPGWSGHVTVQVVNLNRSPYLLSLGDGVFSIVFNRLTTPSAMPAPSGVSIESRLAEVHGSLLSRQSLLTIEDLRQDFIAKQSFGLELLKHLGPVLLGAIAAAALVFGYFQYELALLALQRQQVTLTPIVLQGTPTAKNLEVTPIATPSIFTPVSIVTPAP